MDIIREKVNISVDAKRETSGILSLPRQGTGRVALVVAHGAGNDMEAPLLSAFADGLVRAGHPVLRFNFPYKDAGRKSPDPENVLADTWRAACRYVLTVPGIGTGHLVAAGKSLGGRIASQMIAEGALPVSKIIFLGYPLHRPNDTEKLRDGHLYDVNVPMLFFAGTRDPLCSIDHLESVLKQIGTPWQLFTIEGGDHSFHVPKTSGKSEADIYNVLIEKTLLWLDG